MITPTESFQTCNYNKRKLQKEMPISTDYTPSPSSSSSAAAAAAAAAATVAASSSSSSSSSQSQALKHSHLNAAHQSPYSQSPYSSLFHQQQQPKLHLYGSNYNIDNEHYSNLAQNSPHSTQNLNQNHSLIGDTFGAVQENSSTGLMHAGGGQSMPAPCDYSTHFPDYAAYSSYNHPHYFSPFANSYGNGSSAPIGTNPYQVHWSPLIGPTSINEQCNPVHSSVYPQNGAQHNQWHHKL